MLGFKVIKNQNGSALMFAILLLTGILAISLAVSELVLQGMAMSRGQEWSAIAYFAAEAGAEKVVHGMWKNDTIDLPGCLDGEYVDDLYDTVVVDNDACSNGSVIAEYPIGNAYYSIRYNKDAATQVNTLSIIGRYRTVKRAILLKY